MNVPAAGMRPLAILGGTFDPVHLGHLRAAWEASEQLDAEIRLVPARVPPHRPQPVAGVEQRVALLRASLEGQQRLKLDTCELGRSGPSYSIDTLIALRDEIGMRRPLVLLMGADAFSGLPAWERWRELFEYAHIGVLTRPGQAMEWPAALDAELTRRRCEDRAALTNAPGGFITWLDITPLAISASAVRALLGTGREPRFLLAPGVFAHPALLAPYRLVSAA